MGIDRTTIRRRLRATADPKMAIEHVVAPLGKTGNVLVQVSLREKDEVRAWACSVGADWHVARAQAEERLTLLALGMRDRRRLGLGRPTDLGHEKQMHQRFRRHLAVDGGVWVEEAARGHGQRPRRLLGIGVVEVTEHSNALASLAEQYTDTNADADTE
jgi:hypothetical protein